MTGVAEAASQVRPPDPEPLFWVNLILMFVVMFGVLTAMAYYTWAERKLLAAFQDRLGPTRTGPFGLLQPLADACQAAVQGRPDPGRLRSSGSSRSRR